MPCPSRGPEGRGRRCLVRLEARVEEAGRCTTEREGVCGGREASHGAGRRRLLHFEAQKVAASSHNARQPYSSR